MKIINQFIKNIKQNRLIRTGDHILLGVSGGPDSVALLHLLLHARHTWAIKISVAHINHNLRKTAKRDEQFVTQLCQKLQIKCYTKTVSLKKTRKKTSIEELAREARLKALAQIASKINADRVALGHNQDDLAETVLMRIIRGSGLMGLKGIVALKKINTITVTRPLLIFSRTQIEKYLQQNKLKYRTDETNRQKNFFRNKIRLELIPLLKKKYNKNIMGVLCNLADTSTADYDYLETTATQKLNPLLKTHATNGHIRIPVKILQKHRPAMQRMLIRLSVEHLVGSTRNLTLKHIRAIERLLKKPVSKSKMNLPKDIDVQKTRTSLVITLRK